MITLTLYTVFIVLPAFTSAIYITDTSPVNDYYVDGDLVLGAILPLHRNDPSVGICEGPYVPYAVQYAQAILFILDKVNKDDALLPNTTLGVALLDSCGLDQMAVARAAQFIPVSQCVMDSCNPLTGENTETSIGRPMYDVVGVVGPTGSDRAVKIASLLGGFKVPVISQSASANDLSDKKNYEYFSRMVPPDKYQANAMVSLIHHFNWTYISVLATEGADQESTNELVNLARHLGICVAYYEVVKPGSTFPDFDKIIANLIENKAARVVIMFMSQGDIWYVGNALVKANYLHRFILLAPDTFGNLFRYKDNGFIFQGIFSINPTRKEVPEFHTYYESLSPWRSKQDNQWFGQYLESFVGCVWREDYNNKDHNGTDAVKFCDDYDNISEIEGFYYSTYYPATIDAVQVFIESINSLILEKCPSAFGDRQALRQCVTGPHLLSHIRNVSFEGYVQYIQFDEFGDMLGDYDINNIQIIDGVPRNIKVGEWSRLSNRLTMLATNISWQYLGEYEADAYGIPESVCSKPCGVGEYYIQGELECCWDCRRCRDNEVIEQNKKGCQICPYLTWPDKVNFTSCIDIAPTFLLWTDSLALGLEILGALGVVLTMAIVFVFVKHSQKKVIKGSNRELMAPILIGMILAYLTVFTFITQPIDWSCYASYYGFHLSCTLIFAPLFLKTTRMYRIFAASEKLQQKLKFLGTTTQMLGLGSLIVLQVALTVGTFIWQTPGAVYKMPVLTEEFVELLCDVSLMNLLLPLSFNLILLILCAIFGFLTRKLPDNFNESWYIFISVTTTIFIWIAFLPTHMMAFYAYHKAVLLSLALILNATVTGLCLFGPKIFAVYFVDEKTIMTTNFSEIFSNSQSDITTTS